MNSLLKSKLVTPLIFVLILGFAPFTPEPHLFGKIRWVIAGGLGMAALDIFDLVLHSAPLIWLFYTFANSLMASKKNSKFDN